MTLLPLTRISIHDACGKFLVEALTEACTTSVTAGASAFAATEVRQGLYQEDPTRRRIAVLINPIDPDDTGDKPAWADCLAADSGSGYDLPIGEVGGGEFWARRFTIDINAYLVKTQESRDIAREIGTWVFGRVHETLSKHRGVDIADDFGEHAFLMLTRSVSPYEGGGPPRSFIWRGKIRVEFLTEKDTG